jgi:hypothetical protein
MHVESETGLLQIGSSFVNIFLGEWGMLVALVAVLKKDLATRTRLWN